MICAEAGLSLDAALTRVAREYRPHRAHVDEVGLTAIELGFLPNRRQALNLMPRVNLPPIRAWSTR